MTLVPAHTATTVPESGGVGGFFRSFGDLRDAATNAQPEIDVPALERRVHDLINAQRTSHGLAALAWDGALGDISRAHSTDMAVKDYFEHVNLSGQDASDRGAAVGYDCVKTYPGYYTHGLAENIYLNWLYSSASTMNGVVVSHDWNTQEELAVESVTGWMNSPGHRENILTDSYDRTGVGIGISPNDQVLITQVFC